MSLRFLFSLQLVACCLCANIRDVRWQPYEYCRGPVVFTRYGWPEDVLTVQAQGKSCYAIQSFDKDGCHQPTFSIWIYKSGGCVMLCGDRRQVWELW
jgi:hypothetical protein